MSDSGIGWRGIEQRPVIGLSDLQQPPWQGETGANGPGVFCSMAQNDNSIYTEFLGTPGRRMLQHLDAVSERRWRLADEQLTRPHSLSAERSDFFAGRAHRRSPPALRSLSLLQTEY